MRRLSTRMITTVLLATVIAFVSGGAAQARGHADRTIRNGTCSNGASWTIKAKPDDGRLEVEAEIDTNRAGQTWTWVLEHNGRLSLTGSSTTTARSGSFEVHRRVVNSVGTDTLQFRATRRGAVCVARVSL